MRPIRMVMTVTYTYSFREYNDTVPERKQLTIFMLHVAHDRMIFSFNLKTIEI